MNEETTTMAADTVTEHRNLYEVIIDFWVETFKFFKYIFYDIFLGK